MTRALDIDTPVRIQRLRTKGWKMPPNTVYVGRPTKWGNPFTIEAAKEAGYQFPRRMAVLAFDDWLRGAPWACGCLDDHEDKRREILRSISELRGKSLACFCPLDAPCHADVLLRIANE